MAGFSLYATDIIVNKPLMLIPNLITMAYMKIIDNICATAFLTSEPAEFRPYRFMAQAVAEPL